MRTIGILYTDKDGIFKRRPFTTPYALSAYRKFSEIAMNNDIKVVVAMPEWYRYKYRKFSLCWNLLGNKTEKDANAGFIFNKCISPDKGHYIFMKNLLKKIKATTGILNNPLVEEICNDKYLTYTFLKRFAPKTFLSLKYIHSLGKHLAVIKPRYGSAGKGVKIKNTGLIRSLGKDFILQEFIDTSHGIKNVVGGTLELS